ncbi:uncharacterized protein SOCE26_078960 [Sorangium cellulosum]|uniref:Uncharacterized protein n=1 Tax=Sorangium cellulosum TaxID=56 RepID=A0A2L0F496_SORCE|nr:hypothetical protein [Sorangium cellulosum]AUX46390.1 uncharacterized protein SOCE26_078960 [Sorangium cellulosum]
MGKKDKKNKPKTLHERFRLLGIDFSKPGFYDSPQFRAAEANDGAFLEKYAAYVENRLVLPDEAARVRSIVPKTAQFLFDALVQDGRLAACVDASQVLSRFLEAQGVWNYIVKGALTVSFAPDTGLSPVHMAPIMMKGNRAVTGHAWVCAPPYRVVDVTVALQPYSDAQRAVLGNFFICEEAPPRANVEANDLFDAECVAFYKQQRGSAPTIRDLLEFSPNILNQVQRFGVFSIEHGPVRLKYVGTSTTAPDLPLEEMACLSLSGRRPIEAYHDLQQAMKC